MFDLATTNLLVSYGTVFLLLSSFGLVVALIYPAITPEFKERFHAKHGLWVAFGFTLIASLITLYYSEYLGQAPCSLCWVQRVFLYPQVFIFGIAALSKDTKAVWYSLVLSLVGAVVALYHHYLQMGGQLHLPCPASGNAIDCATPTFVMWGFVTFPFMAFTLFVFLALFMVWLRAIWRKYPLA
jgi:disulfide bond formation protein DsbB